MLIVGSTGSSCNLKKKNCRYEKIDIGANGWTASLCTMFFRRWILYFFMYCDYTRRKHRLIFHYTYTYASVERKSNILWHKHHDYSLWHCCLSLRSSGQSFSAYKNFFIYDLLTFLFSRTFHGKFMRIFSVFLMWIYQRNFNWQWIKAAVQHIVWQFFIYFFLSHRVQKFFLCSLLPLVSFVSFLPFYFFSHDSYIGDSYVSEYYAGK